MKPLMFAVPLVFFAIVGFAADTTVKSKSARPSISDSAAAHRNSDSRTTDENVGDPDVCYSMRVYMFEAKDGEPPQLKGMKTCVESNPRILKKTAAPKAQFKLLK